MQCILYKRHLIQTNVYVAILPLLKQNHPFSYLTNFHFCKQFSDRLPQDKKLVAATFLKGLGKLKFIMEFLNTSIMAATEIKHPLTVDFQHIASVLYGGISAFPRLVRLQCGMRD